MIDFMLFWFGAGITTLTIDWLRGWPKTLADKKQIYAYMEMCRRSHPNKNPRMILVRGILFIHLLLGPLTAFKSETPTKKK